MEKQPINEEQPDKEPENYGNNKIQKELLRKEAWRLIKRGSNINRMPQYSFNEKFLLWT